MRAVKYQEVSITLSAATFSRLQQANPFNKQRAADQAIEVIRAALYTMYPPHTAEEWKDTSRFQGFGTHALLTLYDIVCYLLRKWTGSDVETRDNGNDLSGQPSQLTLKIPVGLMIWIEKIARQRPSTTPEATVYAIEYGHRVLDSQGDPERAGERARELLREIWSGIWKRFVNAVR